MIHLGIDLGTCNSLVAFIDDSQVRIIPNGRGHLLTPSVVGYGDDGEILVGEAATNQVITAPNRTVRHVKRIMGERTTVHLEGRGLAPEEISAAILASLRNAASDFLGAEVREAVVTVPAHFDDRQRHATTEAALLAGFRDVRLLNEPTAAALPYATRERAHERIVVFDFGGGTLDVSCLERDGEDYSVRATVGDGNLGGADIDRLLFDRIAREIEAQSGEDAVRDPHLKQMVLQMAEAAKIELSDRTATTVTVPFFGTRSQGTVHHPSVELRRDELEEMIVPIVDRAIAVARRAVTEAGYDRDGFDTLVLAGGSSRLPVIRRKLRELFDVDVAHRINPEEVVATGAALYAASQGGDGFRLHDVLSGTLSVELADGRCVPILRKNQTVPTARTRLFTTVADGQTEAEVHIVQGQNEEARRNRSLGRFTLPNIKHGARGEARIAVTLSVNEDGVVRIDAGDRDTGSSKRHVARSRPDSTARPVRGDESGYLRSLVRRLGVLKSAATGELVSEIEQMIAVASSPVPPNQIDDVITVVETLVTEIVARSFEKDPAGGARAAS